jgi:hypothetical protein
LYESTFGVSYVRATDVPTAWCAGPGIVKAGEVKTA